MNLVTGPTAVSIVIPTFNRADFVTRAVESALNQTIDCEVIVVDHGSTDKTPDVMGRYAGKIEYVRLERDHGPIFSWLHGVLHSRGDWVKFLFDDDWLDSAFLEESLALTDSDVGFVMTQVEVRHWASKKLRNPMFKFGGAESNIFPVNSTFGRKVRDTMVSPTALLLRRTDALDSLYAGKLPLQSSSHFGAGPDHLMKLLAMLRYPRFGYVAKTLAFFGHHGGSITVNSTSEDSSRRHLKQTYRDVNDYLAMVRFWRNSRAFRGLAHRVDRVLRKLMRFK